jgi:5-methylcytosine-specific restriction endonuclease McrA
MNIVDCNTKTTLLLNNAWQPITAITARAAFAHLLSQNVTALDKNNNLFDSIEKWNKYAEFHEDQPVLRSAKQSWRIPTIIIVTSKFFKRPKKKKLSLLELSRVHDSVCQYCLKKFALKSLTIDHIFPKSKGGTDEHGNRTLACLDCNQKKSDHSPFFNIKNEIVKAPVIPSLFLQVIKIRKEWESFI